MRERLHPGGIIDGYRIGDCVHKGGTGVIYRAKAPTQRDPGFPIVLKVPFLGCGESAIGIIGLEMDR